MTVRKVLFAALLGFSAAAQAERYTIPWFVPAEAGSAAQSVLRIVNGTDESGSAEIVAIDDAGTRTGPVTLSLAPWAAVEFTAPELETGNAAKGLASGLGSLSGDVRLLIDSDVAVVPSAFVRSGGGALAAVHDTVLEARDAGAGTYRYGVAIFRPAADAAQQSRLRLINPGEAAARVTIAARDDAGMAASGGTVELTLPGAAARTLSATQLEAGDSALFTGRLGAGTGNWRLSVTSDRPIQAVNVTVGSDGDWNNLSTTAVAGWAPEDQASFEARFLDRVIVSRDGLDRVEFRFLADNRLRVTVLHDGVEISVERRYGFERIGRDAGRLTVRDDSGQPCTGIYYFDSPTSGWYASGCIDAAERVEDWGGGNWRMLDAGALPVDLDSGPDDLNFTVGTAIDALTLPAASGGDGRFTYSLSPEVPGLSFDPTTRELSGTPSEEGAWLMTYRVRDASGDSDWRYFNIAVEAATGGETSHGVGDTLSDLPTGNWTPSLSGDGSVRTSGGVVTAELDDGTYFEHAGHRYTCQSAGGCTIENRRITSGTVVQTASGTAPGGGVPGDPGDDRASAADVAAVSDTEADLTAGDVDYFRVVLDAPGTLEAYTTGRTDTLGRLEDAGGAELARNDDGGAGTNFSISEDVSAGTYYVRVEGYSSRVTGDYTLHVRFTGSSTGASPSFAVGSGPGDQTYTVGTAISALTLPEATGGDGPLTYSLSPAVPGLTFNATASVRRLTGTPTAAGTYDMTYRVRDTDGDTDLLTFAIMVENAGDGGTVAGDFHLTGSNDRPSGIAFANGRFHVVDQGDDKVYAYTASGQRDSAADFDLDSRPGSGNGDPSGIAFANGRFYVVDSSDDKVYAYTASGQRDAQADFDLAHPYAEAITFTNGRFHVVDVAGTVYAYTASGRRDSAVDFFLDRAGGNGSPSGIAFANGRFHIVDWIDDKVYAYTASGQRDAPADFDLDSANSNPSRIAFTNGRFYVIDLSDDKVYAYTASGQRVTNGGSTGDGPDLVVQSPSASDSSPSAGDAFTLSATVRNDGDAEAPATTLRYYRSSNSIISTSDTQVGTDAVGRLAASDTSAESVNLTAPSSAGTYYYGACVDSVSGESDTSNNCSSAVRVTVSGGDTQATPPAPQNVRVARVGSNVRVTWNSSSGATYYDVWRCNDSVFPCTLRTSWRKVGSSITGTSWLDTNVPTPAPGISVRLQYIVQACNSAGCSGQL